MKKNVIFSLLTLILVFGILSFTTYNKTNNLNYVKKSVTFTSKPHQSGNCTGQVTNLTTQRNGTYITISWSYTGNPYSFNYGGYYQNNTPFPTGNTMSTSITIPYNTGGRIGVLAICSDGSSTGSTANTLF